MPGRYVVVGTLVLAVVVVLVTVDYDAGSGPSAVPSDAESGDWRFLSDAVEEPRPAPESLAGPEATAEAATPQEAAAGRLAEPPVSPLERVRRALPLTPEASDVDHDCADFYTHVEAQSFFLANGGPDQDPHGLDHDRDGLACESLP
ncbi:MAG: hypothetical protein R3362_08525 [Rhodothermales bacterium]|nr:hypothetical protein [Rhodothermales bacterium]